MPQVEAPPNHGRMSPDSPPVLAPRRLSMLLPKNPLECILWVLFSYFRQVVLHYMPQVIIELLINFHSFTCNQFLHFHCQSNYPSLCQSVLSADTTCLSHQQLPWMVSVVGMARNIGIAIRPELKPAEHYM